VALILGKEAVWRCSHTVIASPKSYENGRFIVTGHGQERGQSPPFSPTDFGILIWPSIGS
jgi:hypothetical protein